jgi:hypothetical protein
MAVAALAFPAASKIAVARSIVLIIGNTLHCGRHIIAGAVRPLALLRLAQCFAKFVPEWLQPGETKDFNG